MIFSKDSEERQMLADFYNMCQKHWISEESDNYWKAVISDTDDFVKKFRNQKMAKRLALALIDTKEEEMKECRLHG